MSVTIDSAIVQYSDLHMDDLALLSTSSVVLYYPFDLPNDCGSIVIFIKIAPPLLIFGYFPASKNVLLGRLWTSLQPLGCLNRRPSA